MEGGREGGREEGGRFMVGNLLGFEDLQILLSFLLLRI